MLSIQKTVIICGKGGVAVKSSIVVFSYHHKNTQKVAEVMTKVLDAEIRSPQQTNPEDAQKCDLVGFGAGIDSGKHYKVLLDFTDKLIHVDNKKAFSKPSPFPNEYWRK